MSFDIDDELVLEFRREGLDSLEEAELALLDIDKGAKFTSRYNAIFRTFHSIKGGAGMLGMDKLSEHVHHLESLLEKVKKDQKFAPAMVDYLLKGIDAARLYLDGGSPEFELKDPLVENIQNIEQKTAAKQSSIEKLKEKRSKLGLVMLVDDNQDIVELLSEIIRSSGFDVQEFLNGTNLLEKIKEQLPDVVLTDLQMPGINGMEILQKVHKIDPDLPVVFLSGHLNKEVCIDALSNGAYAFIEKPFNETKIVNILINAVKKYRIMKIINQSINFIFYQFSDIDDFLKSQGKESIRQSIKSELENLLDQRRKLKQMKLQKN